MLRRVTASPETLVEDSHLVASICMRHAVVEIDSQFGAGFAKKNPGLVGQFMMTAGLEMIASHIQVAGQIIQGDDLETPCGVS